MARLVDALATMLLLSAGAAFTLGVVALGDRKDLNALYWLVVGGLLLRSSVEMLRCGPGTR